MTYEVLTRHIKALLIQSEIQSTRAVNKVTEFCNERRMWNLYYSAATFPRLSQLQMTSHMPFEAETSWERLVNL